MLQVDDNFEVVLELLNARKSLAFLVGDNIELLLQLGHVHLIPLDESLQVIESPVSSFFLFVHTKANVTLLNNLVELLLNDGRTRTITLEIVNFLLLHLLDSFVNSQHIDGTERIKVHNVGLHLHTLLKRHLNTALGFALGNKFNVIFLNKLLLTAILLKLLDLKLFSLVVRNLVLVVRALIVAVVEEYLLLSRFLAELFKLIGVLVLGGTGFLTFVHHDNQADDVEFLLVDTVLIEQALLLQSEVLLFELVLDVDNLVTDLLQQELPLLALLLFELLLLLQEVLVASALILSHLLIWLVHPVFTLIFLLKQVLLFLECKFSAHHDFETTLADSVTLKLSFTLEALTLLFFESCTLLSSKVLLALDLVICDFENVLGSFKMVLLLSIFFDRLFQVLLQFRDGVHAFLDLVKLLLLVVIQVVELFIVIALQLKDDLFNQLDLGAFALVCVQFKGLVQQIVNVGNCGLQSFLEFLKVSVFVLDLPVHSVHALDVAFHLLNLHSRAIVVLLTDLATKTTLCQLKIRLAFAFLTLVGVLLLLLLLVTLKFFLSILASELGGSLSNRLISHKIGLSGLAVHEVSFFHRSEVLEVNALLELGFLTAILLKELDLTLSGEHRQSLLLLASALAN